MNAGSIEPRINWLAEQEKARRRWIQAVKRNDLNAQVQAEQELNYAASCHNGTAIYGEDFLDDRRDNG